MKKIPDFLKAYEKQILSYKREYIQIKAEPCGEDVLTDPLKLTQSKFLGFPFIPRESVYPKNDSGTPLMLLAQINFSELPELSGLPDEGLLQVFLPGEEWYDMDSHIVYLEASELKKRTDD